jgi:hypothetical protein
MALPGPWRRLIRKVTLILRFRQEREALFNEIMDLLDGIIGVAVQPVRVPLRRLL